MKAIEPVVLFIMLYKVVLTFESVGEILSVTFEWKLLSSAFLWCWLKCSIQASWLSFQSMGEILGPVVRKPVNADPGLKVNQGSHFS